MKRFKICLICIMLILGCIQIPVSAMGTDIVPYYNNTVNANSYFTISEDGVATVDISYHGVSDITTGATITTKIQKRTLGLIWTTVDIGTTDNVWIDESTSVTFSTSHSVKLKSKGTYRVAVDFVIRGTGGANDEISQTATCEY